MRRLVVVLCGLALAITAAVLTLPTVAFAGALLQGSLAHFPQAVLDVVVLWASAGGSGRILRDAMAAAGKATALICCGPILLTALVGEVAAVRNLPWFLGGTAVLSVALPLAADASLSAALLRPLALAPLLATGAMAGLVYWLVAAPTDRTAPRPPPRRRAAGPG